MPVFKRIIFSLSVLSLLLTFLDAASQTQDSTKTPLPQSTQSSTEKSVDPEIAKQDSLQKKSWLERNPALVGLIGAFIGAAVALIGVLINRQTGKKTSKLTEAEKQTQIRVEKEEKEKIEIQARAAFI
ncbi:MAG: hypothetical protein E2O76_11685 [Caldithrix sp.]|nr:MAG: hypothetical protein E2O76_11685 [Caldithrix sp.]